MDRLFAGEQRRSQIILDNILELVSLYVSSGLLEVAKSRMHSFLTCADMVMFSELPSGFKVDSAQSSSGQDLSNFELEQTAAYEWLDNRDLAIGWHVYIYLLIYNRVPSSLRQYTVNTNRSTTNERSLFLIVWRDSLANDELCEAINAIFLSLMGSWLTFVEYSTRQPYIAILRNFVSFLKAANKTPEEVKEIIDGAREAHPHFPETWDLSAEAAFHDGPQQDVERILRLAVNQIPGSVALWNRCAKHFVRVKRREDLARCLVQAARVWFDIPAESDLEEEVRRGLLLYAKILDLGRLDSQELPAFRCARIPNVFDTMGEILSGIGNTFLCFCLFPSSSIAIFRWPMIPVLFCV